jgi:hypothetical protein
MEATLPAMNDTKSQHVQDGPNSSNNIERYQKGNGDTGTAYLARWSNDDATLSDHDNKDATSVWS